MAQCGWRTDESRVSAFNRRGGTSRGSGVRKPSATLATYFGKAAAALFPIGAAFAAPDIRETGIRRPA